MLLPVSGLIGVSIGLGGSFDWQVPDFYKSIPFSKCDGGLLIEKHVPLYSSGDRAMKC